MPTVSVFLGKSVEQNAEVYYEKAKKAKQKIEGARKALSASRKELEAALTKAVAASETLQAKKRKPEWYEKFRWFISSEGFLVIGGRDAPTNEIVIKKHTDKGDVVFHTDMAGSPFFVIKSEGRPIGDATMRETADATASYSRAWKTGLATTQVFHVSPEQVSKTAQSGEYVSRGAFMIYGKTNYIENRMRLAIGLVEGRTIGGPVGAVRARTDKFFEVVQGEGKPSDIAKRIKKRIGGELDDIIRFLPSGGIDLA
jgi:predicted ribosome quality control (RQC) complex YloA/Tae2 family protein